MSRNRSPQHRCDDCKMHRSLCLCAQLPRLLVQTRVVLIRHDAEGGKSTNTGRLALRCLEGSMELVHGDRQRTADPTQAIAAGTTPLLLYPNADATPLERWGPDPKVTLFVPDGNWRQASKMRKRVSGLDAMTCVSVSNPTPNNFRLRREPSAEGMATLEAIARALAVLEGPRGEAICAALLRQLHAMIDRTLWSRGLLSAERVRGGLPPGVVRHDPQRGA